MNAQTPFDIVPCAHGFFDDEHCPACSGDLGRAWVAAVAFCACLALAIGGIGWLTLSWLGVAL